MEIADSTSPSKSNISARNKQKNKTKKDIMKNDDKSRKKQKSIPTSPAKRVMNRGVRVARDRIYDSENGKCCHQCLQKTMGFVATCKNLKDSKLCTMNFCHKCLLNRYGEKTEDVALSDDWNCPRCRGICNCSFCMKKRGHNTAKATRFSSVSKMLPVGGPENVGCEKNIVKGTRVSPKKPLTPEEKKRGKENSFDGNNDSGEHSQNLTSDFDEKKSKKLKREGLKELHDDNKDGASLLNNGSHRKHQIFKEKSNEIEKKPNNMKREGLKEMHDGKKDYAALSKNTGFGKPQISNDISKNVLKNNAKDDSVIIDKKHSKMRISKEVSTDPIKKEKENDGIVSVAHKDVVAVDCEKTNNAGAKPKTVLESRSVSKCTMNLQKNDFDADIPLPQGTDLTIVSGVEIPPEDIGHALQFIEFCSAFGKVVDVKKGLAECVLQEVINGCCGRRAQYSSCIHLHIQLLSLILSDKGVKSRSLSPTNGKNSWLQALGKCISESQFVFKELPSDCFDRGADGYNELHFSKKLRLLNFICDEVLGTEKLRNWIDNQNSKSVKREKEAKEKFAAANVKEKSMKQKMQDEVAKAIIANSGAPLSISEHEAIVAQIKLEAAQAHTEMLAAVDMLPKKRQICDSVRTEPILMDVDGRAYWRLKGCSGESDILLQELGTLTEVAPKERWLVYDAEQKKEIEKYISFRAAKKLPQGVADKTGLKPLERQVRRICYKRKDLSNRIYASDEARTYAIARAKGVQSSLESDIPNFVKPMLQSHVTGGFWLGLPNHFCKAHLPSHDEMITLVDEQGNKSLTKYLAEKTGLSGGWRGFAIDHELVDGDALVFQLITPTKFKVYIVRVNVSKDGDVKRMRR